MRTPVGQALSLALLATYLGAQDEHSAPANYVFFGLDRGRINEESFLSTETIEGAQLKYTWAELEPTRDDYALEAILADLEFLEANGKHLFVQVQDVSFGERGSNVPRYLTVDSTFSGGVAQQYGFEGDDDSDPKPDGMVARRWDPTVRQRHAKLLGVLGRALDGRIEGITLPETAVGFGNSGRFYPPGFSNDVYLESIKQILGEARGAFSTSEVLLYANFMPGEWLPWEDHGYLRSIYSHADRIGAGVGGPDLLPHRRGQRNHAYRFIAARSPQTKAGVAVQDGNLAETNPLTGRKVTVGELYGFATEALHVDYLFWGTEEPYYSEEVLPFLKGLDDAE